MAVTDTGIPIINIDTSQEAMSQAGLTQPRDATVSIAALAPQVQQVQDTPRRRYVRKQPQQPYQQSQQPSQQFPQQMTQDSPVQQYQQQISVEKLE
jgi:hypothetical protein